MKDKVINANIYRDYFRINSPSSILNVEQLTDATENKFSPVSLSCISNSVCKTFSNNNEKL